MSIACNSWAHSVKLGGSRGGDYTERSCKGTEWNCGIHVLAEVAVIAFGFEASISRAFICARESESESQIDCFSGGSGAN